MHAARGTTTARMGLKYIMCAMPQRAGAVLDPPMCYEAALRRPGPGSGALSPRTRWGMLTERSPAHGTLGYFAQARRRQAAPCRAMNVRGRRGCGASGMPEQQGAGKFRAEPPANQRHRLPGLSALAEGELWLLCEPMVTSDGSAGLKVASVAAAYTHCAGSRPRLCAAATAGMRATGFVRLRPSRQFNSIRPATDGAYVTTLRVEAEEVVRATGGGGVPRRCM